MSDLLHTPIVSCETLKKSLEDGFPDDVVILDVSWSSSKDCYQEYKDCHIPGARYMNVLNGENNDFFPRNLPAEDVFQEGARKAGINKSSHVIVYSSSDQCGYFLSGRAWWTFKNFGISSVSILDGGLQKWKSIGGPLTDKLPNILRGDVTVTRTHGLRKEHSDVIKIIESQGKKAQICDTRAPTAFSGGHIPAAKNIPLGSLIDTESCTLKSIDELRDAFSKAGVNLSEPIVTHCNSGMSSCTVALAASLCGNKDAAVYHGGFTEFSKKSKDLLTQ